MSKLKIDKSLSIYCYLTKKTKICESFNNLSDKPPFSIKLLDIDKALKTYRINRSKTDPLFKEMITRQFFKSILPYLRTTLAMINPNKEINGDYVLYVHPAIINNKPLFEFCRENEYSEPLLKSLIRAFYTENKRK